MVLIVNLNPAIDRIYTIDGFQLNQIHRTSDILFQAGGKGINVARATKVLKGNSLLTGITGGHAAGFIIEDLNNAGIDNNFCFLDRESRTCLIIIDRVNSTQTVINEDGPLLSDCDIDNFIEKFKSLIKNSSILVLSGSLPQSLTRTVYRELCLIACENNVKSIIDTSKHPLKQVLEINPFLIKPNIYEFADIFNDNSIAETAMKNDFKRLISCCDELIDKGVKNIIISLGEQGAILVNDQIIFRVEAPKINAINAIASGDSMTAAIAMELSQNRPLEESLISGVAAGTANATIGGLRFTYEKYLEIRTLTKSYYIERI